MTVDVLTPQVCAGFRPDVGPAPIRAVTLPLVPLAVVTFQFDPALHLGDRLVRWETLAVAGAILVGLFVAALVAGRIPAGDVALGNEADGRLRRDDLLYIVLGIAPGALAGGRLADVALHLDYFRANPEAVLDPARGGLSLTGAVVLGSLSGALVARLFEAPLGRWLTVAAVPILLVLGLGKAAEILGGTGQGLPFDGATATRYLGAGPWGSLGPAVPAHPAQAYEAAAVGMILLVVLFLWALGAFRANDGRAFPVAVGGWAVARFAVATTWRDPATVAGLRTEQLLDLAVLGLAVLGWLAIVGRSARAGTRDRARGPGSPAWPDPEEPRRF